MKLNMGVPNRVDEVLSPFRLSNQQLHRLIDVISTDLQLGLEKGCPNSSAAMLPSFLPALPDRTGKQEALRDFDSFTVFERIVFNFFLSEQGKFLSIDLSGTNFRCMLLSLPGQSVENGDDDMDGIDRDQALPQLQSTNYVLTKEIMTGTGDAVKMITNFHMKNFFLMFFFQLFDFVVSCLEKFLNENNLLDANLPLGFVFSYPCEMLSLRRGHLLWWTKGFTASNCVGQDVVQLLEQAIARNGVRSVFLLYCKSI